jgi:hypothetical protein
MSYITVQVSNAHTCVSIDDYIIPYANMLAKRLRTLPNLFMQCLPKDLVPIIGHIQYNPTHWLLVIICGTCSFGL